MNTVRIPRLLKQATLLLTLMGSTLLLTACGGGGGKSSGSSSSLSSSVSSHTFSSTSVTPPLSGTWPDVKVSASGTKTLQFDWSAAPEATYYKLLKKVDANSAYAQVGSDFNALTVSDPVSVHLTDWVNSRYKVQACNAADVCIDSSEVIIDSTMLSAITYLKASNADEGDWFGWSIALSGDGKTLAVGVPAEASNAVGVNGNQDNNTSPTSGAVYVFVKVDGNWVQEAYIKASNTEQPTSDTYLPNDRFGYHISLSYDGNILAVSAIGEDSPSYGVDCSEENERFTYYTYDSSSSSSIGAVGISYDIGAIYIFNRDNTVWTQTAYIKPSKEIYDDLGRSNLNFGYYFELSGDGMTLAVGNPSDSTYIFGSQASDSSSSITSSLECHKYNLSSSPASSLSTSVSTSKSSSSSSSRSSLSAANSSSSALTVHGGSGSGAVYIFKLIDNKWAQVKTIKATDAYPADAFGISIALSFNGDILAVGATGAEELVTNSSSGSVKARMVLNIDGKDYPSLDNMNSGAVYVYKRTGDMWQQSSKIVPANQGWDQQFGYAVSLSDDGNTLAVGTPGDWSITSGTTSSPTYTYEADLQVTSSGYLYIVPKLDMTRTKSAHASGAVYVYKYSDANGWNQDGYIKASNPQTAYQFGSALSLSGSGDVLAVGCYRESSQAVGVGGDEADLGAPSSGAAYVFKRSDSPTPWTQENYIKAPNGHTEDRFARVLSLDFTGDILAVGAYRESSKARGINGDRTNTYDKAANAPASASGAAYLY